MISRIRLAGIIAVTLLTSSTTFAESASPLSGPELGMLASLWLAGLA